METAILPLVAKSLVCLALLSVGVVYGTDIFFALIGRKALAQSSESAIVDVMGHLHEVADARMPIFGAVGLLTTLAFVVIAGLGRVTSTLGLVSLAVQVLFLVLYSRYSKPINERLRQAAGTKLVPADTRQMQEQWDRVVVIRASLLFIAMACLLLAGVLW